MINGSTTIGASEFFLASNSTSQTPQTTDVDMEGWLDFSTMLAGDQYQITLYEKVNGGTQQVAYQTIITGVQSSLVVIPRFLLGEGWDVGVKKLAGTDRVVAWSLRNSATDSTWVSVLDGNAPANAQTAKQILNLIVSAVVAKLTQAGTTVTVRDTGDTKNRIVGTTDSNGQRTVLTTADGS
jgi:hypothetical protein